MKKLIAVLAVMFSVNAVAFDPGMPYQQWREFMAEEEIEFAQGYATGYAMSSIIAVQFNPAMDGRYCAPSKLPITVTMLENTADAFVEAHPEIDKPDLPMAFWLPEWFKWMFPCD